jgi:hypothetical protein
MSTSAPFLYAIETPEGDWYDGSSGEACVFGDVQSARDAILGLNEDAPDDQQFKVVPLYRDAELAPTPVRGKTFEEWRVEHVPRLSMAEEPIALEAWNAALVSKEAEIAELIEKIAEVMAENKRLDSEWKQTHEWNSKLVSEHYDLRSPGPCGRHPKMFYHTHTDSCYGKIPETEGTGDYLRCGLVAGCTLCAELASAQCHPAACRDEELWRKEIASAEARIEAGVKIAGYAVHKNACHKASYRGFLAIPENCDCGLQPLLRALGRKVEP